MEKLNIVGKRTGNGFVANRTQLVNALSRTIAERIVFENGATIGKRGLINYLKTLVGTVVKVIPVADNGKAKQLLITCNATSAVIGDMAWLNSKSAISMCSVKVCKANAVKPNIGNTELADALNRVIPFTTNDKTRPVLDCVKFIADGNTLKLVSADGFRLAIVEVQTDITGECLIPVAELVNLPNALKRAKRVNISIEQSDAINRAILHIDTDMIGYQFTSADGNYPDYNALMPTEYESVISFDTNDALNAVNSITALTIGEQSKLDAKNRTKDFPIMLSVADGKIVFTDTESKNRAEVNADVTGDIVLKLNGTYLKQALRACSGMVDLKVKNNCSPVVFGTDGFTLLTMPMIMPKAEQQAEPKAEQQTEPKAEPKAEQKPKANKSNTDKKQAVAV